VTGVIRVPENDARCAAPDSDVHTAAQNEPPANDDARETPAQPNEDVATHMQISESGIATAAEGDALQVQADAFAVEENNARPPPSGR